MFRDVDLSAYKRGVKRPEFERMLEAVRAHDIDGVLAWKVDRLTRRQRDLVRLDEACEDASGFIATVVEGIDTRQATGRFVAELLVAQARMESSNMSTRLRRKAEEQAKAGAATTGGTRAFGYDQHRRALVPEEAALVREAVSRILAGEGVRGICFDWQRRGIVTPTGRTWTQTPLRRLLVRPAIAGYRQHGGKLYPGTWPAIITLDEHERARALLEDPGRRTIERRTPYRYELTGLVHCGVCGEALVARPRGDKARRYVCARRPGSASCGKLARLADPLEATVAEMVFVALEGIDLAGFLRGRDERPESAALIASIRADEESLEQLARDYYADRIIGRAEFIAARDALTLRLEGNRRLLAGDTGSRMIAQLEAGEALRTRWPHESIDWRRAVLTAVIDRVVVRPAVKGRNRFDPSTVEAVWKF